MSTAAQQFAQWIEATHPDFYRYLVGYVAQQRGRQMVARASLRGFGDDSGDLSDFVPDIPDVSDDMPTVTVTGDSYAPSYNEGSLISSQYSTPSFQIPTLTASDLSPGATASADLGLSTDSSGSGFLATLGSGISSAATGVASFVTSPQGLSDITKLATAFFQVQNTRANAQLQAQVLQAQAQRASFGQSPVPVTYGYNAQGVAIPIYTGANLPASLAAAVQAGQSQLVNLPGGGAGYSIPTNTIGGLAANPNLTQLLPWIALIVGGLVVARELSR